MIAMLLVYASSTCMPHISPVLVYVSLQYRVKKNTSTGSNLFIYLALSIAYDVLQYCIEGG